MWDKSALDSNGKVGQSSGRAWVERFALTARPRINKTAQRLSHAVQMRSRGVYACRCEAEFKVLPNVCFFPFCCSVSLHPGKVGWRKECDAVDEVDPNIGGIGHLLTATIPYVQYPYGMARLAPITAPGITDRYLADRIYGFPAGPAMLMASVGTADTHPEDYASEFDHDLEKVVPTITRPIFRHGESRLN